MSTPENPDNTNAESTSHGKIDKGDFGAGESAGRPEYYRELDKRLEQGEDVSADEYAQARIKWLKENGKK